MQERGWFIDENKSLVHESEVGVSPESMGRRAAGPPITGPTTSYRQPLRRVGNPTPNPGLWNDIKNWWAGLKPQYRWGILGGAGLLAVITAALGKKEGKSTWLKKV